MAKKLQMCGTEEEMREAAARICRDYLHGAWKSVKPQELDFKRISGGLSNFLYYVALPDEAAAAGKVRSTAYEPRERSPDDKEKDKSPVGRLLRQRTLSRSNSFNMDEPKKVLLRIYGQVHGERALDAIVTESVIFTLLSERKLGPKLHGVFSGGRIEEYIPARSLLTKELSEPALSMKIAEKMASIHSMDVPLMKEPNWLWKTISKWVSTVDERLATVVPKDENEERLVRRLKQVQFDKEIEWLKRYLCTVESPVLFCHNDMQEGNILLLEEIPQATSDDETCNFAHDESSTDVERPNAKSKENNHTPSPKAKTTLDTLRMQFAGETTTDSISSHISDNGEPKLVLIDFEYCAYNYRGFDIANHFQEWMYDYTNAEYPFYFECRENCPSLEQKEIFIREYLKHYLASTSDDADEDTTPTIEDVNQLLSEVEAFSLASHLLWTLWSAVNATKSKITFGYWDYGVARVEMYFRLKQEIVKKEKYGFPQKRKICEVDI